MDHDRRVGEGAAPQEYVGIKIKLLALPPCLAHLAGRDVFAVAATLRPETMAGQTNCWALPSGTYAAFETAPGGDVYVCTRRAARNMAFQGLFAGGFGALACVCEAVPGAELIGLPLAAPLSPYAVVYMLPLLSIKMNKGTGLVTSVPSDSPDDYAAFAELKKPKKHEFYGVKAEWIEPFEPVPIIDIPELGACAAEAMCLKLGVQGPADAERLAEAHDVVYTQGFYKGVMLAGAFAGKSVQEAKPLCKALMVAHGQAFTYLEPDREVISRSDDECVVALVDQWYKRARASLGGRHASSPCHHHGHRSPLSSPRRRHSPSPPRPTHALHPP
jgi:leucyl-tRNA synthetase